MGFQMLESSVREKPLMRYFDSNCVTILLGGPACCFCVSVSDLLTYRATFR